MLFLIVILALFLSVLLYYDIVATYHLVRDPYSTRTNKISLVIFVWAVPLIGVLFVLHLLCQGSGETTTLRGLGHVQLLFDDSDAHHVKPGEGYGAASDFGDSSDFDSGDF